MNTPKIEISVIIPFLNEEKNLQRLLPYLQETINAQQTELIFIDGGSEDGSRKYLVKENISFLVSPKQGRASQMNYGAKHAKGKILYFLHADTLPNPTFEQTLLYAFDASISAGCFQYEFDSKNYLLKLNSWFTQFNGFFAGGGDQSLYIKKSIFEELDGFNEDYCIMEDFEFVRRFKNRYKFHIFASKITVSARKYDRNN